MKNLKRIHELGEELQRFLNKIHGLYLDSVLGFEAIRNAVEEEQAFLKEWLKASPEIANEKFLDTTTYVHENKEKKLFAASGMHRVTQGEIKTRNKKDGENHRLLGNMCIVMLYSYWEDYFREELAKARGIKSNDIQVDIWGDIMRLRHSIIHNNGIANLDIDKIKILKWYKQNDEIFIDQGKIRQIILNITVFINLLLSEGLQRHEFKIPISPSQNFGKEDSIVL